MLLFLHIVSSGSRELNFRPNIALSAATCGALPTVPHTKYIPPHPQRGSPYHRYCLLLLPHVNPNEKVHIPPVSEEAARVGFNLRTFCEEHGLDASLGGGAHMWREVWNETVSDIYKNTLSTFILRWTLPKLAVILTCYYYIAELPEPHYALPPRPDPYAEVKSLKKFVQ